MNALILLIAMPLGQCEGGQCAVTVATSAGISVDVQVEAEHKARTPVRKAVSTIRERKPVRTRLARLRENKPVRTRLLRLGRRCRR